MDFHNYFIGLEDRFIEISKYVEIEDRNFKTFSSEIALVYMAACSEFEVVSIELCKAIEPTRTVRNIEDIFNFFSQNVPEILEEKVELERYRLMFFPFENWTINLRPEWWKHYNKVKHNRTENYHLANIGNLLQALSALQAVNYYLIWKRDCVTKSRLAPPIHMSIHPSVFKMAGVSYQGPFS